uniref:Uncharacterized protein n=1 Tax=Zea mays TaxID=4577 RepID=C4J255_MAIZE|nr:unknown [Zea mays]
MLLSPPGGFRMPPRYSRGAGVPSAKMSLPLISFSFAELRDFSAEEGTSSLKMLLPVSSWNFWLWIFFAVFTTGSSLNEMLLGPPAGFDTLTDVWTLRCGSEKSTFPCSSMLRAANGLAGISGGGPKMSLPLSSLVLASESCLLILASASSRVPLSSRCLATSGIDDGFFGETLPSALNEIWLIPVTVCWYILKEVLLSGFKPLSHHFHSSQRKSHSHSSLSTSIRSKISFHSCSDPRPPAR